jgi:hypothetical protein
MFGLFKKRPPEDPPTEKQRRYAAKLGIEIPSTMSKADLSAAIAAAERKNPSLARQREHVKAKSREKKFGKQLIEQEEKWNRLADKVGYILAVYSHRKQTIVDVLRVSQSYIDDRGKLRLVLEAPKVVKDRHIGDYLDWVKELEIPITALLYHEPLHPDFHSDGNDAYRKIVERGLKIARQM